MPWINVKHSLPGIADKELFTSRKVIITNGKEIMIGYLQYDSLRDYLDEYEEENVNWTLEGPDMYRLNDITHWMNLPRLPGTESKAYQTSSIQRWFLCYQKQHTDVDRKETLKFAKSLLSSDTSQMLENKINDWEKK